MRANSELCMIMQCEEQSQLQRESKRAATARATCDQQGNATLKPGQRLFQIDEADNYAGHSL
eukprot:14234-Heterococcus_DN1.PRE.2